MIYDIQYKHQSFFKAALLEFHTHQEIQKSNEDPGRG